MKKTILGIYALAVCFVTVACFVVALGLFVYGVIGVINPEFTLDSWSYTRHQTNDAFWGPSDLPPIIMPGEKEKERVRPSEAELTKQRLESYVRVVANERRGSTQRVVKTTIVILIDILVFFLHWRIARREDKNAA